VDNTVNIGSDALRFQRVTAVEFKGDLISNAETKVFDAATGFISYAALQGAPQFLSEFTDDIGFLRTSDLDDALGGLFDQGVPFATDIKGSVFGDDSTVLIDGTNNKILGEVDTSLIKTSILTSQEGLGNFLITGGANVFGGSINITGGTGTFEKGGSISINGGNGVTSDGNINIGQSSDEVFIDGSDLRIGSVVGNITVGRSGGVTNAFGTVDFTNATVIGSLDGELIGSVFYDDSTLIIDAVAGRILSPIISGDATFEDNVTINQNLTVSGNFIVQGTTTNIETVNTVISDNVIVLNNGEVGAGVTSGISGFEVDRGTISNVNFLWDDNIDKWTLGNQTLVAATFEGNLTGNLLGNVTGNVTGNTNGTHTGSVVGNVTGNISGNVVGDLVGSVFGDDSTPLVDSVAGVIRGDLASTRWTSDSYTNITINGFLEIEPQFFQLNTQADGYMQFNAGDGNQFGAGYMQFNAGDGGSSTSGFGGYIQINAGNGTGSDAGGGGYIQIEAGNGSGLGALGGGHINITAGDAGGGDLSGGYVSIQSGSSSGSSLGSYVQLRGGDADNADGGEVRIFGGSSNNATGGDVVIEGGFGGNGTDGQVRISNAIITGNIDNTNLTLGATDATTIDIGNSNSTTTIAGNFVLSNALIINNIIADDSISITTADGDGNAISIGPQGTNTFVNLTADSIRFFGPITESIDAVAGITGDITGSVFGDDSTLLVDAVNSVIPYSVLADAPTALSDFSNDLDYAGIVGTAIQNNGLPVDTFMTGNLDAQGNDIIDANLVNATGNLTGDVKGSVFADDSSVMVDAVNFVMFSDALTLTPLNAEPENFIAGTLVAADGVNWDPASKVGAVPYPVFYDGVAWNALY
jgi:hypothetical protein